MNRYVGYGIVGVGVAVIAVASFSAMRVSPPGSPSPTQGDHLVCTMEVKQCPDGSFVGRSGPRCDFAVCPLTPAPSTWKIATTSVGIVFQYPPSLPTTFISAVEWPPKVIVVPGPFLCMQTGEGSTLPKKIEQKTIDGRAYCVTSDTQGAAGSLYTHYQYATMMGEHVVHFSFSIRAPQCGNYENPQKTACENEEGTFSIDDVMGRIVSYAHTISR
ncbi:MAG: hypothetical protein ACYC8S_01470 [Minisyncoccota bacterium]